MAEVQQKLRAKNMTVPPKLPSEVSNQVVSQITLNLPASGSDEMTPEQTDRTVKIHPEYSNTLD
jgi:hypothetical protein